MKASVFFGLSVILLGALVGSCGQGVEEQEIYGQFDTVIGDGKEDSSTGSKAVPVSADSEDMAVWTVRNAWGDTDTTEARKAGLAWEQNSGLDWNEKFARWVRSLPKIQGVDGYSTFSITNPQGKTVQAPVLECAEVAYFLRAAFASWYNLPLFIEAKDSHGVRVFLGHFGLRTATGRYNNSPLFKSWYKDYSGGNYAAANWPKDEKLRAKKLAGAQDDYQPFLFEGARAGAYFDELFLNKRAGHFMILFLDNFGSIHLADSANTFNLKPEALREGDVLLERWQRSGIGHTLNVKLVDPGQTEGTLTAELASGSMPRRQPKWEDSVAAKRYFTSQECGGSETSYDGVVYAAMGGGLKRWRVASKQDGYWVNIVLPKDVPNWISSSNIAALGARVETFKTLLDEVDPAKKKDILLAAIESARENLRQHPASCSSRTSREKAFDELYALNQENYGIGKLDTDKEVRKLEDYVFAELEYSVSKTCCWNSTTPEMYQIIMDYEQTVVKGSPSCVPPVVFMNDGGYQTFADYAGQTSRGSQWLGWTEDEPCSQRSVAKDTETAHAWTDFCTIADVLLGGSTTCTADTYESNNSLQSAATLAAGSYPNLTVCADDQDWFRVYSPAGTFQVSIQFSTTKGDLDMELTDDTGAQLGNSAGSGDIESIEYSVTSAMDVYVHVFGYNGAVNSYAMNIVTP